jgi:hypothetical protein
VPAPAAQGPASARRQEGMRFIRCVTAGAAAALVLCVAGCSTAAKHGSRSTTTLPLTTEAPTTTSTMATPTTVASRPSDAPTPAQVAALASKGVGCAPVSSSTLEAGKYGESPRLTARLNGYVATVTGISDEGRYLGYRFRSTLLGLVDPKGRRFQVSLGPILPGRELLTPQGVGPDPFNSPLCLVRFAGQPRPAVLLGVGGPMLAGPTAFWYALAVPIGAAGLLAPVTDLGLMAGAAGYNVEKLTLAAGHPLLVGANGAFGYQGAFTAQPPVVMTFADGHFVDVTRNNPALVAGSAAGFWATWKKEAGRSAPATPVSVFALEAWAAVECATSHQASAYATLSSLDSAGWFNWGGDIPSGAVFVRITERELVKTGYCTR